MGHMDEALTSYKPASIDDLELDFPAIRRPEPVAPAQAPQAPEVGEHGGAAAGTAGATNADTAAVAAGATSQASAAPEPAPQRDETDDGEHTRSVEEVVVVPAAAEEEVEPEEEPAAEPATEPDAVDEDADAHLEKRAPVAPPTPEEVNRELDGITGREPKTFQKTGFTAGDVETLTVKPFPVVLVDRLRLSLAPATGGAFAQALSAPAIITAFLIAKTGLELEVDANTAVAVDVFRQVDPRLLSVEDKLDEVLSDVGQLAAAMKSSLKRISETAVVVDGLEFSSAYLIADRVAGLTSAEVDETNVDVAQKKVLAARDTIRRGAKKQRDIERQRDGRRMA